MASEITEREKGTTSPSREDPPEAVLWQLLKRLVHDSDYFKTHFQKASEQMWQLDQAPRHDTILTDLDFDFDLFRRLATTQQAIALTGRSIRTSLAHLKEAEQKIARQLRGEDKVNLSDRLHRHLVEAQALLEAFQTRSRTYTLPNRPFEIRRQYANSLFLQGRDLHEQITAVRNASKDYESLGDSCSILANAETQIARIQARLGKFRDNPSQKLGAKMGELNRLAIEVHQALEALQAATEAECRRLGVKFFNRQGPC